MTDCPPRLRGDLSKWLCQIDTGVYVGRVSSRVRDALWKRICENLKQGRATMVYTTNGEQKMEFCVHNSIWTPVDFDGIKLMRRPLPQGSEQQEKLKAGFSQAAQRRIAQKTHEAKAREKQPYVILDLETTGLKPERDSVIEVAALRVEPDGSVRKFSHLVQYAGKLPDVITQLTGITEELLQGQGIPMSDALDQLLEWMGNDTVVGYNIRFDMEFIRQACIQSGRLPPANRCLDLLSLARRKVYGVTNVNLNISKL